MTISPLPTIWFLVTSVSGTKTKSLIIILPAEISEDMTKKVKELAIKAYKTVGCSGVSRVDFLIVDDIPYVLEINTSPGMTETSDLPAQSAVMGIDYDNLVLLILNSVGLNK